MPYAAPAATIAAATSALRAGSTVMLRKPGPATSTFAMPSAALSSLGQRGQLARAGPAGLASWSATLVA